MKVYLYQKNREPYFWTKDELTKIEDGNPFLLSEADSFVINDIEFILKNINQQNINQSNMNPSNINQSNFNQSRMNQ